MSLEFVGWTMPIEQVSSNEGPGGAGITGFLCFARACRAGGRPKGQKVEKSKSQNQDQTLGRESLLGPPSAGIPSRVRGRARKDSRTSVTQKRRTAGPRIASRPLVRGDFLPRSFARSRLAR